MILKNRWFQIQKESIKSEKDINIDKLNFFLKIKDSPAVNDTSDLILQENWIALPSIYRNLAVNLVYAGHLGLTKAKALLKSKVFFPNVDKITTQVLGTSCKSVTPSHHRQKLISQPTPSETLDTINLDFLDPFLNGQHIIVAIDQRTKYPNREFM